MLFIYNGFKGGIATDTTNMLHSIMLNNRNALSVSGVLEVISFDEESLLLNTSQGRLTIRGEDLHILGFNTEFGDLTAEGKVYAIAYVGDERNGGFLSRLFK